MHNRRGMVKIVNKFLQKLVQRVSISPTARVGVMPVPTAAGVTGKLFMVQSDMQLIDLEPQMPFAFSIDDYQRQLVLQDPAELESRGVHAGLFIDRLKSRRRTVMAAQTDGGAWIRREVDPSRWNPAALGSDDSTLRNKCE